MSRVPHQGQASSSTHECFICALGESMMHLCRAARSGRGGFVSERTSFHATRRTARSPHLARALTGRRTGGRAASVWRKLFATLVCFLLSRDREGSGSLPFQHTNSPRRWFLLKCTSVRAFVSLSALSQGRHPRDSETLSFYISAYCLDWFTDFSPSADWRSRYYGKHVQYTHVAAHPKPNALRSHTTTTATAKKKVPGAAARVRKGGRGQQDHPDGRENLQVVQPVLLRHLQHGAQGKIWRPVPNAHRVLGLRKGQGNFHPLRL